VVVVVGYWSALQYFHSSFKAVIQDFTVFSLIFLAVCAFFSRGRAEGKLVGDK
jgi:hypothetical protein